jgi:N-acyl-L-homoserine lactone synthetase
MLLLIRPRHHRRFRAVLNDSFRLRREVFEADRADEIGLEHDAFDGNPASYLVDLDDAGRVIATVRATPGSAASPVCADVPRGADVAEISRLCVDPWLPREQRLQTVLRLRAGMAQLFGRRGWTRGLVVGHDRHIQAFVRSGMTVRLLGPPVLLPGDSQLSFVVLASEPGRPERAAELMAGDPVRLRDPDEDLSLFTRYGDRAVA